MTAPNLTTLAVTCTLVDISTAHIPKHTADALDSKPGDADASELQENLIYTPWGEYGWIIYCGADEAEEVRESHPELSDLMSLCASQGICFLKLDCDASKVDGLPVFNW